MIDGRISNWRMAFTLTEMLISLAVGLVVIQIAFASFFIVQKYVNRIKRLDAANQVLQSAITWHGFNGGGTYPHELQLLSGIDYSGSVYNLTPAGEAKVRRMPQRIIVGQIGASGTVLKIYDLSSAAHDAFQRGEKRGITGWESASPDPRILAEFILP